MKLYMIMVMFCFVNGSVLYWIYCIHSNRRNRLPLYIHVDLKDNKIRQTDRIIHTLLVSSKKASVVRTQNKGNPSIRVQRGVIDSFQWQIFSVELHKRGVSATDHERVLFGLEQAKPSPELQARLWFAYVEERSLLNDEDDGPSSLHDNTMAVASWAANKEP